MIERCWGRLSTINPHSSVYNISSESTTKIIPNYLEFGAEEDSIGFAYYMTANMPWDDDFLQALLETNHIVDRYRYIILYSILYIIIISIIWLI
jgi:hypothetical protein